MSGDRGTGRMAGDGPPGLRAGQLHAAAPESLERCMAQRENMQAIFNGLAEGILTVDREFVVTNANIALGDIVGVPAADCAGQPLGELLRGADQELDQLLSGTIGGRPVRKHEITFLTRSRDARTAFLTTAPLTNPDGEVDGVIVVLEDITEIRRLTAELEGRSSYFRLIGRNPRMLQIYDMIEHLADNDVTVLIAGESGTGKELVAHAIHYRSHRSGGPLVRVNCAALAETLLESELFGHAKGAFTGAVRDRIGRFEEANGGTIFLDEIGDISMPVQQRLLRVLQERELERVGESRTRPLDVRVIAATHRDLRRLVDEGRFREDLYYRLHVVSIELPPLRERREDIPLLVQHFVEKLNASMHRQVAGVSQELLERLLAHDWPGNVRELENAIQRAMVVARGRTLRLNHLAPGMAWARSAASGAAAPPPSGRQPETSREALLTALAAAGWNKSAAARLLGVDRSTVWRRMRRYGIADR
jgi:PAS domain S-box-containing protein